MQQIIYHGIASYRFEYKLSTDSNWTTEPTQNTNNGSCNYTFERLTGGKSYDLRVTVTDQAGNSGTGTNTANTSKPEKNPGGIIEDITTDDLPMMGQNSNLTTENMGKPYDMFNTKKTLTYSIYKDGTKETITFPEGIDWFVFAEDEATTYVLRSWPSIFNPWRQPV